MKSMFIKLGTLVVLVMLFTACNKEGGFSDVSSSIKDSGYALGGTASSTGQSIMVDFQVDDGYVITEEYTYHFDADAAADYFHVTVTGPVIDAGTGAAPAQPDAPDPRNLNSLNGPVNRQRCTFFSGGQLEGDEYTQSVTLPKGWKYTWTYTVTGDNVAAETAWTKTFTQAGEPVSVPINVTIAGLSALSSKQHPLKYSFSLLADDGITNRVQNLKLIVDGVEIATPGSTITGGVDFFYTGNAGSNGVTSLLTDNQWAYQILNSDSFAANNDISNAICAKMDQVTASFGAGLHTITLTGIVKGNSASATLPFTVTKEVIINGGCN